MTVLIKGMEMPKSCEECALNYDSFACIKTGNRFYRNDRETDFDPFKGRLEDCPLVPVPPHGRLVDADILYRVAVDRAEKRGDMFNEMDNVLSPRSIKMTPTVIPAEREEAEHEPPES